MAYLLGRRFFTKGGIITHLCMQDYGNEISEWMKTAQIVFETYLTGAAGKAIGHFI